MRFFRSILLPVLLLVIDSAAEDSKPKITSSKFDAQPENLFYFDDSETVLFLESESSVVWRTDSAGESWKKVSDIPEGKPFEIWKHPYNNKLAVALGMSKTHWVTKDQGETWRSFETKDHPDPGYPLSFHADDIDRILFHGLEECGFVSCTGKSYYTTDGFESLQLLRENRKMCQWARNTDLFSTGDAKKDKNMVVCIVEGKYSSRSINNRLVLSSDFFDSEVEPELATGRTVSGIINMAAVKGFLVAAAKSEGTDELALYVTDDTSIWHRAEFGDHRVEEDAYTILESTNYSIQVDVMSSSLIDMGTLFTSNSNGTYFTRNIEHTNRGPFGFVDFEKITNIQGIVLVNTVSNWEDVQGHAFAHKKVISKISFDDGRTFHSLKAGDDDLHLHSVTDQSNSGRVFSSLAPGLVMGVGNTGDQLKKYTDGDLYVSDDAGLNWRLARKEAHKYEFGDDGSVLVAIYDEGETDEIAWSLDHGKTWKTVELPDGKIKAQELTTVPDSTSLKFILTATKGSGRRKEYRIYTLDFAGLRLRKCKESDFEDWYARKGDDGKPTCIMGHKTYFRRRKADIECVIDDEFSDPVPHYEECECTIDDYECDFNFVRNGDECVAAGKMVAPEGECRDIHDTFKGSSGWRKIPGNRCIGGLKKDEPVQRPCAETKNPPASGEVKHTKHPFQTEAIKEYYYLERTDAGTGDDETVVLLTSDRKAFVSHDHGVTWEEPHGVKGDEIAAIYPHSYFNDVVYLVTPSRKVHYSKNRLLGDSTHIFEAPEAPNTDRLQILGFHPKEKDWIIWTGGKDCDHGSSSGNDCHSVAHISKKGGESGSWDTLLRFVQKCQFVWREHRQGSEDLIFCEQYELEDKTRPLQLISSEDRFEHKTVHNQNVVNFATMSEFIIVASKVEDQWLKVDASIDGKTFAEAAFPRNFKVQHQQAYTVLDSSTHAVFLHVTVNNDDDREYGSILKSNSNGTSYVLSVNEVNRNRAGYVDFEKMQGLEGVAIINVVGNVNEVNKGSLKKKKTKITHNDGADWSLLSPPEKDVDERSYKCSGKGLEKCSLHLHGYTERKDPRDTFSSPSAVGLMLGVGNVGEFLGKYNGPDTDTFITRDGGITWKEVIKGKYMWEYGDQGSIIVIVEEEVPTDHILYSLDEGEHWREYKFSNDKVLINDISTVPSDTSTKFLLWGREGHGVFTINLDFSGLYDRMCKLDEDDYYLWTPRHPAQNNNCLFGHVAQYYRKKASAKCFNGRKLVDNGLKSVNKICECTRKDFECDYNFERQTDNSCALSTGLSPADPSKICSTNSSITEYYDITGYRKIPISTCEGGLELDLTSTPHACPGHEEEFERKHGISGVGLFFAIVIPIAAAAGVGYWVHQNWDGKFGRIRLGEGGSSFDSDAPWVRWPVVAFSAAVAVLAAIPLLVGSLWRSVSNRFGGRYGARTYNTRAAFARGRGDYAVVDPMDEGELLGEDSDEEV
ncbi:Oligoxyloglucan reducing end-specific cellobiohydrolase [Patellaria atrata CBS 101060]|uniref:Vacuolar protein sorting/targeting protein 10 n=1 Tax=Patellaria atrata CBS 101060 TaxID=1346257 RepID=A0A9P4VKP0_9PEZI|nr:Oligoxyloglucan reducing end-specific cellobiohydrolase [Patellaria atrata CBS 101060]